MADTYVSRKHKFKIWQEEDGRWCCGSKALPRSWSTADTLEEAVKAHQRAIADFQQMQRYFAGTCEEGCRWCKDHPETHGIDPEHGGSA